MKHTFKLKDGVQNKGEGDACHAQTSIGIGSKAILLVYPCLALSFSGADLEN